MQLADIYTDRKDTDRKDKDRKDKDRKDKDWFKLKLKWLFGVEKSPFKKSPFKKSPFKNKKKISLR